MLWRTAASRRPVLAAALRARLNGKPWAQWERRANDGAGLVSGVFRPLLSCRVPYPLHLGHDAEGLRRLDVELELFSGPRHLHGTHHNAAAGPNIQCLPADPSLRQVSGLVDFRLQRPVVERLLHRRQLPRQRLPRCSHLGWHTDLSGLPRNFEQRRRRRCAFPEFHHRHQVLPLGQHPRRNSGCRCLRQGVREPLRFEAPARRVEKRHSRPPPPLHVRDSSLQCPRDGTQ
mmetsp:Transcript_70075/g.194793  ORF Transcript_70075/g.194793 Transcript_70075/m.194793 type:complete len:231 (+) Transcript_70075:40-732(+)